MYESNRTMNTVMITASCRGVACSAARAICRLACLAAVGLVALCRSPGGVALAADLKARNVFFITTDGLRWEEVFTGADPQLIRNKEAGGVSDTNAPLWRAFWRETPEARREALLPFLWGTVARQGQLWGNRAKGSSVLVSNGRNFSYPGYSEMLTGVADPRIDSNNKVLNPNPNVFEWLNARPACRGRVAAAVTWEVLPWILNAPRGGLPVWSAYEQPAGTVRPAMPPVFDELLDRLTRIWGGVTLDTFTAFAAKEIVRTHQPRALYVSLGETDDWAHDGRYDRYLYAAHNLDRFLAELWELVQSISEYRGQTALVISTDHGRGPAPVEWKSHGEAIPDSAFIWIAVLGPDTPPLGERENTPVATQSQLAATVAALIGEDFAGAHPAAARPLPGVVSPP